MRSLFRAALLVGLVGGASGAVAQEAAAPATRPVAAATKPALQVPDPWRFRGDIKKFAKADETGIATGGIVFTGSSSARFWEVKKAYGDLPVLNRGFGGSQLSDNVFFIDRTVLKYKPKLVVLYVGSNDLDGGKPPEWVAENFKRFAELLHAASPETKLIYVAIKPSPSRPENVEKTGQANVNIKKMAEELGVTVVDPNPKMLDTQGNMRPEIYRKDKLHFNDDGYEILNAVVGPVLRAEWAKVSGN